MNIKLPKKKTEAEKLNENLPEGEYLINMKDNIEHTPSNTTTSDPSLEEEFKETKFEKFMFNQVHA